MKICLLCLCLCVFAFGADYPLKSIGIALSKPERVTKIPTLSKNLLESTSGIKITKWHIYRIQSETTNKEKSRYQNLGRFAYCWGLILEDYTFGLAYPLFPAYHQQITLKYESSNFEVLNSCNNELDEYPLDGIVAKQATRPYHTFISKYHRTSPKQNYIQIH